MENNGTQAAGAPIVALGVLAGFIPKMTVGVDLGTKKSALAYINGAGELVEERKIATDKASFEAAFTGESVRIALEVGTQSAWVSRLLSDLGHEVFVADARKLELISKSNQKSDENDAVLLARIARADPTLLNPIRHKSPENQELQGRLRARDALVRSRTLIINVVRGSLKVFGLQLKKVGSETFHRLEIPEEFKSHRETIAPMMASIESLTEQIKICDRQLEQTAKQLPTAALLQQVQGVGPVTALAFIATIGDPSRFKNPRSVGPYLGLTPKRDQSGDTDKDLPITKAGNKYMRRLLISSAQYILGAHAQDSDLRRWAEHSGAIKSMIDDANSKGKKRKIKSSKSAKKRAVVATARKLGVLLMSLWKSGEQYDPLRNARARGELDVVEPIATAQEVLGEAKGKRAARKPRNTTAAPPQTEDLTPSRPDPQPKKPKSRRTQNTQSQTNQTVASK